MKWMHIQTTLPVCAECAENLTGLPEVILRHTDWDYACKQTDAGCVLTPTFRHMPYRNGFVPEIEITVSHEEEQTILHIIGQPTRFSRVLWACLYGFLLLMEVLLLAFAAELDTLLFLLIPVGIGVFGYVLCKCAMQFAFASVVKALRKAFC